MLPLSLLPLQSIFRVFGLASHAVGPRFGIFEFDSLLAFPGVMQSTTKPPSEWHKLVVVLVKPPNTRPVVLVVSTSAQFWPAYVIWLNKVLAFLPKSRWHSLVLEIPRKSTTGEPLKVNV